MAYASRLDLTSFTTRRWLQVFPAHKANHESSPDFDFYYSDSTKGDKIIWPKNHTRETFSLFRQIENSSFPVCALRGRKTPDKTRFSFFLQIPFFLSDLSVDLNLCVQFGTHQKATTTMHKASGLLFLSWAFCVCPETKEARNCFIPTECER